MGRQRCKRFLNVDVQLLYQASKIGALQFKVLCCLGLVASAVPQRAQDNLALMVANRIMIIPVYFCIFTITSFAEKGEILRCNRRVFCQNDRPFYEIAEFPDIAGPVIAHEVIHGCG